MNKDKQQSLREHFMSRNIEFDYFETRQALIDNLMEELQCHSSIGIGNSQTLKELGVTELSLSLGKTVYDKTLGKSKEEVRALKRNALLSDCYVSSCNGITMDGKIINIDHSGNRVAALTYGPERVLLIVGINKLVETEKDAMKRALSVATPMNARRSGILSPCSIGKSCDACTLSTRVCNYISVIRGQHEAGRMKVFLLNEILGF